MKRLTIDEHKTFLAGLLTEGDFDDILLADPYEEDPPSKRKDADIKRVLDLLDSLEFGEGDA